MAVKIEWQVRAAGRERGDRETVELTEFVEGCIRNGVVTVVGGAPKPAPPRSETSIEPEVLTQEASDGPVEAEPERDSSAAPAGE